MTSMQATTAAGAVPAARVAADAGAAATLPGSPFPLGATPAKAPAHNVGEQVAVGPGASSYSRIRARRNSVPPPQEALEVVVTKPQSTV